MTPGMCRYCTCTEAAACEGGCAWTDETQTLCTSCLGGQLLAEKFLEVLGSVGRRTKPPLALGGSLRWDALTHDQQQLLVMSVRAVLEHVTATLADELSEDAADAMHQCHAVQAFLLEHAPHELEGEGSLSDVVTRLLQPHIGPRILMPGSVR